MADAAALVYGSWCPKAAAKFANLELLTTEALQNVTQRIAKRCSQTDGNGHSHQGLADLMTSIKPLVSKVADALSEAKSCGCHKITCTWCKPGQAVSSPVELANQYNKSDTQKVPLLNLKLPGLGRR